jgi:arylsulfatase
VDAAGATYPARHNGHDILPREGRSLVPALHGEPASDRALVRTLFFEHEGNRAVRDGDWKLVALHGGPWELYDLAADRTELHDLAARQPERVQELAAKWEAWAERCHVKRKPK